MRFQRIQHSPKDAELQNTPMNLEAIAPPGNFHQVMKQVKPPFSFLHITDPFLSKQPGIALSLPLRQCFLTFGTRQHTCRMHLCDRAGIGKLLFEAELTAQDPGLLKEVDESHYIGSAKIRLVHASVHQLGHFALGGCLHWWNPRWRWGEVLDNSRMHESPRGGAESGPASESCEVCRFPAQQSGQA